MGSRPGLKLLLREARRPSLSTSTYLRRAPLPLHRRFSTHSPFRNEIDTEAADRPRWQATPRAMIAPVRTRPLPENNDFAVNSDPAVLNDFYVRLLGPGGDKALTEETRWLAVTHKSFDHGRRGFNDRLAYLGEDVPCAPFLASRRTMSLL